MGTLKVLDRKLSLQESSPQAAESIRAAVYQVRVSLCIIFSHHRVWYVFFCHVVKENVKSEIPPTLQCDKSFSYKPSVVTTGMAQKEKGKVKREHAAEEERRAYEGTTEKGESQFISTISKVNLNT